MLKSGLFTLCRTGCQAVADFPTCVMSGSQGQCSFTCYANICPGPLLYREVTHVDLASWLRNAALNTDSPSRVGAEEQLLKQVVAGRHDSKRGRQNPDPVSGLAMSRAVRTLAKLLPLLGSAPHLYTRMVKEDNSCPRFLRRNGRAPPSVITAEVQRSVNTLT